MRVVAGSARGRRLLAPKGRQVRPTSDRVREAVFNALGSLGVIEGAAVVDLFAGSGALGIEALSRGAATATFVEVDPRALDSVRTNLAATALGARATVVTADALHWLGAATSRAGVRFDVALVDPPYSFSAWDVLLAVVPADLAVVESDRAIEPGEGWAVLRRKAYGTTVVTIIRRHQPSPSAGAPGPSTSEPTTPEPDTSGHKE